MRCPKCGRELGEGKMLCEYCGEELKIVPDYEPEIEINMELPDISDEIDDIEADEDIDNSEYYTDSFDIIDAPIVSSRLRTLYISVVGTLVLALLIGVGIMIYHDNSAKYQIGRGDKYFASEDYKNAIKYYKDAVDIEPAELEYRMKLADCYLAMQDFDMAIDSYKGLIAYDPDNTLCFTQVIALYEESNNYSSINSFLHEYGNENILDQFKDYLADEPILSVPGGEYDDTVTLTLTNEASGTIYYTFDGSSPDENSEIYTEPLILGKGEYIVKAIFVNDYGVVSPECVANYLILAGAPEPPVISLDSGTYDVAQMIKVTVPEGCVVYYTIDGSDPNRMSRIYGEPIPVEPGITKYRFAAFNSQNVSSEIVEREYSINIETAIDEEQGLAFLYQKLVASGYIKDATGASDLYPGIFSYLYADIRCISGVTMYCYNEYYFYGTGAKAMTSKIFGVDVMTGQVYQVSHGTNDTYNAIPF